MAPGPYRAYGPRAGLSGPLSRPCSGPRAAGSGGVLADVFQAVPQGQPDLAQASPGRQGARQGWCPAPGPGRPGPRPRRGPGRRWPGRGGLDRDALAGHADGHGAGPFLESLVTGARDLGVAERLPAPVFGVHAQGAQGPVASSGEPEGGQEQVMLSDRAGLRRAARPRPGADVRRRGLRPLRPAHLVRRARCPAGYGAGSRRWPCRADAAGNRSSTAWRTAARSPARPARICAAILPDQAQQDVLGADVVAVYWAGPRGARVRGPSWPGTSDPRRRLPDPALTPPGGRHTRSSHISSGRRPRLQSPTAGAR